MENFTFQNKTKIIFGKNAEDAVGRETALLGNKVLLHYGGGSIKKSGLFDRVTASLDKAGVSYVELGGVKPNPRLSLVNEGIEICARNGIQAILAVGGGSVIDSAKAIGVGVFYKGDVWDFFEGKAHPGRMLPLGTVLTIPAAGSEASPSTVITKEDGEYKRGLTADCMRPDFSLLNPELTYTLPPEQTAAGVADMLAHVMERYFTRTTNVALSDNLCEAVMKTIVEWGPVVLEKPTDYAARAEIMWAGTLAHNDLIGMGRVGDWATHDMEHEISGISDLTHGAGLAILFPAWLRYVTKVDPARVARFGRNVFGVAKQADDNVGAKLAIEALQAFYKKMGLPSSIKDEGVDISRIPEMADKATKSGTSTIGNFLKLAKADIEAIMRDAV